MIGRYCRVEPLDAARHTEQLFGANGDNDGGRNWTYLLADPPTDLDAYRRWLTEAATTKDAFFHAIIDPKSNCAIGLAAYMRIDRSNGVIEIGNISFSPLLKRTRAATEALFMMMRRVFDEMGYRRCEWKCDSSECSFASGGVAPGVPTRRGVSAGGRL